MEFINSFRDEFFLILPEILRILITDAIALALVYLLGRMLGVVKTDRSKNVIAFIAITGISFFYSWFYYDFDNIVSLCFDASTYIAFSIIVYVLVAFKLYDRVDVFLDKKLGANKELPSKKVSPRLIKKKVVK